jgi:hypothetical protein
MPPKGAEQLERARLALLEEVCDPLTWRQFDAIGVGEGWRCLDVGAMQARVDALRRLLAAVRPGGWLALHEPDFNAIGLSMLELGASDDDLDAAERLLPDPRVTFRSPVLTTAWAQRPQ